MFVQTTWPQGKSTASCHLSPLQMCRPTSRLSFSRSRHFGSDRRSRSRPFRALLFPINSQLLKPPPSSPFANCPPVAATRHFHDKQIAFCPMAASLAQGCYGPNFQCIGSYGVPAGFAKPFDLRVGGFVCSFDLHVTNDPLRLIEGSPLRGLPKIRSSILFS